MGLGVVHVAEGEGNELALQRCAALGLKHLRIRRAQLFETFRCQGHKKPLPIIKMPIRRGGRHARFPCQRPEGKPFRTFLLDMRLRRAQQGRAKVTVVVAARGRAVGHGRSYTMLTMQT